MRKYLYTLGYYLMVSTVFTNAEIAVRAVVAVSFRLDIFPIPFDNPTNCTLASPQNVVTIIPLDYQGGDNETNIERIEPLGNGHCGARVHNVVARSDAGRWILTISNAHETMIQHFRITTFSWETPVNRTTQAVIGSTALEYHGLWRLEIGVNARRAMGGFIRLPEGTIPGPKDIVIAKDQTMLDEIPEINVQTRDNFRISCETEYSAGYYWIGGPLGQEYTHSENLTVGRCSVVINGSIASDHSGIWTCNMGHVNGGPEEQFLTRVNVMDDSYHAVNSEIEVRLGMKTVLGCRSVLEFPLEYCRFVRPDGKGFGVVPGAYSSDRYSYEGPGLDYGYCGLAISSVELTDIGEWKCASRSRARMWDEEDWALSSLKIESETNLESFWSPWTICMLISIGFVLLVFVAGIITAIVRKSPTAQDTVIIKSGL